MIKKILLLGNPQLYKISEVIKIEELDFVKKTVNDLHDTLSAYRRVHGAGRAIAAPQIGVQKRLLYLCIEKPVVFINPQITFCDDEKMEVMDDCMSFPGLIVKVHRYKRCTIKYYDLEWKPCEKKFEGDLAELLQHEYDHLDGILATMRADNSKSLYYRICV